MDWLKNPTSPKVVSVFHLIIFFNIIFMIYIEEYYASLIFGLLLLGSIYSNRNTKSRSNKQISDDVAEAMASKIIFEAEQHRKSRGEYNYIKIDSLEEE